MISEINSGAHSAEVEMKLIVDGVFFAITHMATDFIILKSPIACPPCQARIFLQVDQNKQEWDVLLTEGISPTVKRVIVAPVA